MKRPVAGLWAAAGLGLLSGLAPACSTVDRDPVPECLSDADCGAGTVCAIEEQTCVPEELAPRRVLAFDIREGETRVELHGCDPEVSTELGGAELRVAKRGTIVRDYDVRPMALRPVLDCETDPCIGECDADALTCLEPIDATVKLGSSSRLALSPPSISGKSYLAVPDPPLPEGEVPAALAFTWPRYDASALEAHAAAVLDTAPTVPMEETNSRSNFLRILAEDAPQASDAEIQAVSDDRCQRGIYANEPVVRTVSGTPVIGATIDFTHAEPIAAPSTVLEGTALSCNSDDECPAGWACHPDLDRCGLDLEGVPAGSTVTVEELGGGFSPARVYTYCEDEDTGEDPLLRSFDVRVTPPDASGLPATTYQLTQTFPDPPSPTADRRVVLDGTLCLPDWQAPISVGFSVRGEPVELLENEQGTYACCDTVCLPTDEPGVDPASPPVITNCHDFERVRFETKWVHENPEEWVMVHGCDILTEAAADGSAGRYSRDVIGCEDPDACSVALTPGDVEDSNRVYTYTITQPVGSVFRSHRANLEITPLTTDLGELELLPRVLVRGSLACPLETSFDECLAAKGVFAAERLVVDTDEVDPPGPFYFQARADAKGEFVLPLDPGVYVVTAYPAIGSPGGPAPYEILDLREGAPGIEVVDGVPHAEFAAPIQLEEGTLVRALLRDFDVSAGVTPIDTGSWVYQDNPLPYDLNDPATCYGSSQRGCVIRRLRPTDAQISLLITRRFQFTTRSTGPASCPE